VDVASAAEVKALLAVVCPFCGAPKGTPCGRSSKGYVTRPTTLDGEAHDARWQAARLGPAPVLSERLAERRDAPVLVASAPLDDRPW
jgi:hypothetical protein